MLSRQIHTLIRCARVKSGLVLNSSRMHHAFHPHGHRRATLLNQKRPRERGGSRVRQPNFTKKAKGVTRVLTNCALACTMFAPSGKVPRTCALCLTSRSHPWSHLSKATVRRPAVARRARVYGFWCAQAKSSSLKCRCNIRVINIGSWRRG